jgi:hypothetical protein
MSGYVRAHSVRRKRLTVLKITIDESAKEKTIRLEGKLMGPWVEQFNQVFKAVAESLGSRRLKVDLCGLSHVSVDGRQSLSEIHHATGAEFVANTPITKYFAQEATRQPEKPEGV